MSDSCHGSGAGDRGATATLPPPPRRAMRRVVLAGNPNVGKSSLFNALTGLHQKVTNYPGITVERRAGTAPTPAGPVELIDLPGAYSLSPHTAEEVVARDEVLGRGGEGPPDLVVLVLDATNLARNLFFATQVLETGVPCVVALNQVDAAEAEGLRVDAPGLSRLLGVPVVPTVGRGGVGIGDLAAAIAAGGARGAAPVPVWRPEVDGVAALLAGPLAASFGGREEARRRLPEILGSEGLTRDLLGRLPPDLAARVERERASIPARGVDGATASAEARYAVCDSLAAEVVRRPVAERDVRERLDAVLTHRVSGTLILLGVFALLFQAVFAWSGPLMDAVDAAVGALGGWLAAAVPAGLFREFLTDGLVAGFAGVLVFVPQIAVMFILVEVLDDSGYLARAAFLLDRLMGSAGLPGRAFLPLMSSFACAIPGVMAARTIRDPRDRMATIFIAPFMSCSARLPVYAMVIGALFSTGTVLGILSTGAVVMIAMYLLGIAAGLLSAGLLRRTLLRGGRSPLLLELPAYRLPDPRSVVVNVSRRTWQFVSRAGPVILVLSVVLWVLAAFPRGDGPRADYEGLRAAATATAETLPEGERERFLGAEGDRIAALERQDRSHRMESSYAGRMGRFMEPVLEPLGFDWKIGIGIIASFAAREVFVSTLGIVYAAGDDEEGVSLREAMLRDVDPRTGRATFRPLVGVSLLVFFVLAMQCISTLAIVRRETGGWKWPLLQLGWMTGLAYVASLVVYQAGSAMGW